MSHRILIVDDHAIVRRMLKVLVQSHPGWEVCAEAENGQDAIAKVKELQPDLVVMDMAMPVKDGIAASREISATLPSVPILMHTLHYSPELELEAKKSGVRKVVAKAEPGDGLLHAIAELLADSSATDAAKSPAAREIPSAGKQKREIPAGGNKNNHESKN